MKKVVLFALFFFLFSFIFVSKSYAAVVFQDSFDDGNSDGWTPVSGANLWQVKNINGNNMYGARIETSGTLIDTTGPSINTPNYQIDFDYLPIAGTDRNLDFRWTDSSLYEVHFLGENSFWTNFGYPNGSIQIIPSPVALTTNQLHHITIILQNQNVQFILDGTKIIDYVVAAYNFTGEEKIGFRISTGSDFPSEAWFDNVVVQTLDDNSINLNVPLLKQYDKPWGNQLFDSANTWAEPSQTSISNWGCAITSAVMVLKYYGITKMPDGQNLDPGTLNRWLKSQPDGYVNGGNLWWYVLGRFAKQAKNKNPNFSYDTVEYKRIGGQDDSQLTSDLSSGIPGILEESNPEHFIVAKGKNNGTFTINDPANNRTDLTSYSNKYNALLRLIPANSDLSYIVLSTDKDVNISLTDSSNTDVGDDFIQKPLEDDQGNGQLSGDPFQILHLPTPNSGNYSIQISSLFTRKYNLNVYFYDLNGEVKIVNLTGIVSPGNPDIYSIYFDKNDLSNTSITSSSTITNLISDINELCNNKDIDNSGICFDLLSKAQNASDLLAVDKNSAKNILAALENDLDAQKGKHVDNNAYGIISSDLQSIIASL